MKKVINGSLFDTATAAKIGKWNNGIYGNDFDMMAETLYRTKSGKYFLYGEGGPHTRYGVWHGNSGGFGEKIMLMPFIEAQKWAEEHLDGDEYIAAFGEPEEGKTQKSIWLKNDTIKQIEMVQAERGGTMSEIVEALILGGMK